MMKPLKIVVYLALALVVLLVLAVVLHPLVLGPSIKAAVEKGGPLVTQTKVTLERVKVNLFLGRIELRGLVVGNPAGFQTEAALKLGAVRIAVSPLSVFSSQVHVTQIYVDGAEAWYEMGRPDSNIGKLQKNLDEFLGAASKAPTPAPGEKAPAGPGKKVVVDDLQILNTKVHVGVKGLGGAALPISMPDIVQKDLGKQGGGKSAAEVGGDILKSITGGVADVVAGAGAVIGEGAKAVEGAAEAGKAVGKGIKNLFGGGK